MLALEKLNRANKVILVWVSGHQSIPRNEIADTLAKEGASKAPTGPIAGVPFAVGKETIRSHLSREHLIKWKTSKSCRQAKLLMKNTNVSRTNELLTMSRQRLRVAVGLLTGHSSLLSTYLFNLGLAERRECRLCGDEREDSVHLLCHCPSLLHKRYRIWGRMFLNPPDLGTVRVVDLLSLVLDTRLAPNT